MLIFALAAALAADASNIAGKWQFQTAAAGREGQHECTFTQTGKELGGTCTVHEGNKVELKGRIDGQNVTWTVKSNSAEAGGEVTVVYTGKVDSDSKMSGKLLAVEFSVEGEFSGTRSN